MKNINVVIGIRRLRLFEETAHHPAPNLVAIDKALEFVEDEETPLDIVKVGLNEGFPVLYYTKSHKNNIVRIRFTEDRYYVQSYLEEQSEEDEYDNSADAAAAVVKAIEAYVDRQSTIQDRPAPFKRRFKNGGRYKERRGDNPSFRHGKVKSLGEIGTMVETSA